MTWGRDTLQRCDKDLPIGDTNAHTFVGTDFLIV